MGPICGVLGPQATPHAGYRGTCVSAGPVCAIPPENFPPPLAAQNWSTMGGKSGLGHLFACPKNWLGDYFLAEMHLGIIPLKNMCHKNIVYWQIFADGAVWDPFVVFWALRQRLVPARGERVCWPFQCVRYPPKISPPDFLAILGAQRGGEFTARACMIYDM